MSEFHKYPYWNTDLSLEHRIRDLIARMTIDEKISILPTHQSAVERLGIKEYGVGGEAAHGVVARTGAATVFPQPIGLGCTWDADLMKEIGSVIGDEARVYYKKKNESTGLTLWAPTIDMERDPRWGRTEEAYGEDPYLTGKLSSNLIKGMQGDHPFYLKLVPAPKHFYGNNNEEGRIWGSSSIDPRNKQEYYLKAFKPAYVEGRAYSMMTAYNEINGTPCIVNPEVQKIVKEEWGCDGFIVCDGGDMSQTVEYHKYYKTHAETIANALKSGVDCFTDDAELVIKSTREALERNLISEEYIDRALTNIFKVRFRLGQFDPEEMNPYANIKEEILCSEKHNALALKAARESIVLLKNKNNILPLNKDKINKVAVIGPLADVIYSDWYTGTHPYKVTPLQGIENKLKDKEIEYKSGNDVIAISSSLSTEAYKEELFDLSDWGFGSYNLKSHSTDKYLTTDDNIVTSSAEEVWGWFVKEIFKFSPEDKDEFSIKTWNDKPVVFSEDSSSLKVVEALPTTAEGRFRKSVVVNGINEAVTAARTSDAAIVFVGNNPLINGKEEIDRTDIILPPAQEELIKAVYAANPNTIVVVTGSYPFALNWEQENIPAILYSAHGCQELGNAIADVLFGDYSPAGRLNMTWYSSIKQLPYILDYDIIKEERTYMYFKDKPLYPFGYGLSYTNFSYRNLELSSKAIDSRSEVTVSFEIKNTGSAASDEVVQMYVGIENSRVKRPVKELKGFRRVHLKPNEGQVISFVLKAKDLAFWDVTRDKFCVEVGRYTVMLGSSSEDIKLKETLYIKGETIPPRDLTKLTRAENYDDYYGIKLGESKEGGTCTINMVNYAWISFDEVDFEHNLFSFEAGAACVGNSSIELRLDSLEGELIGTCNVWNTGNWQCWATCCCNIKPVKGTHRLYIRLRGSLRLSWFKFL